MLDPISLEASLPWVRFMARRYATRWPDLDADELEGRVIERWVAKGRAPFVRWVAIDYLREIVARRGRPPRERPELPAPPSEPSQLALDAYVLECRALGCTSAQIAAQLGISASVVRERWARADRASAARRGRRWNWRGERVSV